MKDLGGFLVGNNEQVFMETCTGGGSGVADGGRKSSIDDPLFDCLLRQCSCIRTVATFGAVFVAGVSWEVKRYMFLSSIMVCSCDVIDGFIVW